jgi:hypothetical protein
LTLPPAFASVRFGLYMLKKRPVVRRPTHAVIGQLSIPAFTL